MPIFLNRRDAGKQLAAQLQQYQNRSDVIVLGIPRGGMVVADEIARALHVALDVFITHKLGAPKNPELAIGAVASDGTLLLDQPRIQQLHIPQPLVTLEYNVQMREISRRLKLYRAGKPPLILESKIVIVADDGIATGATTLVALKALRKQNPARLVLAAPVAPAQVVPELRAACDELVVLNVPANFLAVGYFYEEFDQVEDKEVVRILNTWMDFESMNGF